MLISPDSRISGILFLIIFVSLTLYFGFSKIAQGNTVSIYGLLGGVGVALLLMIYVIRFNRFDVLAKTAKVLLSVFFIVILAYFISSFYLTNADIQVASPESTNIMIQNLFFYGVGLVIAILFYILLLYSVVGVKALIFSSLAQITERPISFLAFMNILPSQILAVKEGRVSYSPRMKSTKKISNWIPCIPRLILERSSTRPNYVMGIC